MDRTDVAYVINTTPKYFYLLPLHIGLIYRYAPLLKWDIWIATEESDHPIVEAMRSKYGVKVMLLDEKDSGFLASRAATFRAFSGTAYEFVIPVQEDFLLERFPDFVAIEDSMEMMRQDASIQSIRWMPCPGPHVDDVMYADGWKVLDAERDAYLFTFQMCIWRPTPLVQWYSRLCSQFDIDNPGPLTEGERRILEIRANYAENREGQKYFKEWFMSSGEKHLAWMRVHKHPNAVYMSPWPYRPTAVVGGKLESWAVDLALREGFPLVK
jgi:hypothetical protein